MTTPYYLIERMDTHEWAAWRNRDALTWTRDAHAADRYDWRIAAITERRTLAAMPDLAGVELKVTEHIDIGAVESPDDTIARLTRERDEARRDLAASRERVGQLEEMVRAGRVGALREARDAACAFCAAGAPRWAAWTSHTARQREAAGVGVRRGRHPRSPHRSHPTRNEGDAVSDEEAVAWGLVSFFAWLRDGWRDGDEIHWFTEMQVYCDRPAYVGRIS